MVQQRVARFAVTVHDYDEAIAFYTDRLGFELLEDSDLGGGKRWVRVRPPGVGGAEILLARATTEAQQASVGHQTGGRVFVFIETDDLQRDHERLVERGVRFVRPPEEQPWGTVAVFEDLYGNRFDLVQPRGDRQAAVQAKDIRAALGGLSRLVGRTPRSSEAELASSYAQLGTLGAAGIFVTTFSGDSEWERHRAGDELVQVIEGQTELTLLTEPPTTLDLRAGMMAVVPRGCWHRFHAPSGVSTLTVTPQPTDHRVADPLARADI